MRGLVSHEDIISDAKSGASVLSLRLNPHCSLIVFCGLVSRGGSIITANSGAP